MAKTSPAKQSPEGRVNGELRATPWAAADKARNNLDAAENKHVVLGLIFLKYISDAFAEKHEALTAEVEGGADPEDPDEYRAPKCVVELLVEILAPFKGRVLVPCCGSGGMFVRSNVFMNVRPRQDWPNESSAGRHV